MKEVMDYKYEPHRVSCPHIQVEKLSLLNEQQRETIGCFNLLTFQGRSDCINHMRKLISEIKEFNADMWLNDKLAEEKLTEEEYKVMREFYINNAPR